MVVDKGGIAIIKKGTDRILNSKKIIDSRQQIAVWLISDAKYSRFKMLMDKDTNCNMSQK